MYSRFTFLENTTNYSPKVARAKFLGSERLSCFISISNFERFNNPFATITSLPELHFTYRTFILSVQTKEEISMSYGSSTGSWKLWRWLRHNLIFMVSDVHVDFNMDPMMKCISSSKSTEFKDILPWSISQMITNIIPVIMGIVMRYAIKWTPPFKFQGKSMETETTTRSEFLNGADAIVEQILGLEERKKSIRGGLWELQSRIRVENLFIWVRSFKNFEKFEKL